MRNFIKYLIIIIFINFHVHGNDALYSIQDNQVFLQNDNNILDLREKAKNIAFENAFRILIKKIIDSKDLKSVNQLDNPKIDKLVNDYKITDEQISDISYSANISVNFNQKSILQFFRKNKIRVQTLVSDEYLVFPILDKVNTLYLWEKNNIWYDNLKSDYDEVGLLKLFFPEKNHLNKLKISARQIIKRDIFAIKDFLKTHKKKKGIIIFLRENFDKELGGFKLDLNLTIFADDNFEEIKIVDKNNFNEIYSTSQIKLISKTVNNELQMWWKTKANKLELKSNMIDEIFIKHYYDSLKKSLFIEKTLFSIFNNEEITLFQVQGDSVIYKVMSNFSIDKINLSLSKYGLVIKSDQNKTFQIDEIN